MTDRELMQQALDALNHVNVDNRVKVIESLRARLAQPEPEQEQRQRDMPCIEDDGCPTEKAVLQRFWRKHQQPEPEPVAWIHKETGMATSDPTTKDRYAGTYIPLYPAPPQRKEWQELSDYDVDNIVKAASGKESAVYLTEAKLKEKNNG